MKIGEYKVELNYGILKGVLDVLGVLMVIVMTDLVRSYIGLNVFPDRALLAIYPDGVPFDRWLPGLILPAIAYAYTVLSVVYVFKSKKLPKRFSVNAENAQQYYDHLMYANSILRVLVLLALWDYSYIIQIRLLYTDISLLSIQAIGDVIVGVIAVLYIRSRIIAFAPLKDADKPDDKA
ncbi:MAG: hypothetical protein J1E39_05520 [Eubacterium sp.]|nr:hypothetical protein [Eubacterium sp.]